MADSVDPSLAAQSSAEEAALRFLFGRINYERLQSMPYHEHLLKLDRMRCLLRGLGDPHLRLPVLHIAGTKGKGSTAAMLATVLSVAGYRTGLYTSPHLERLEERIAIDGRPLSRGELAALVDRVRPVVEAMDRQAASEGSEIGPTYFELITALAMLYFAERGVDVAVLEVGLGGRLDSTNVGQPVVCAITSISFDHCRQLGNSLAEIEREKAGIIKPGVPAVIAPQLDDAMSVIQRVAGTLQAPLVVIGQDWSYTLVVMHPDGQSIEVRGPAQETLRLRMPLIGAHEAVNATVAVAAAHELRRQSFSIDTTATSEGVRTVEWPGRTEILSRRPWIMVAGAHNGASARCLLDTVEHLLGRRRIMLIFGASVDKRIDDMFEVLLPAAHRLIVTQADHPRAAPPGLAHYAALLWLIGHPHANR